MTKRVEQLNEGQIAQIREIFTLFDKNSDGYVNTSELGYIIRALDMNPTQAEVKDMEREVDPNDTGSFDQMNLISLIARKGRQIDNIEEMKESLKVFALQNDDEETEDNRLKVGVDNFKFSLGNYGEKMQDHEIEEILKDCVDLIHSDTILIDDLAAYLMSR